MIELIECLACGAGLAPTHADGRYDDNQRITCSCGAVSQIFIDKDDGATIGTWWCMHGKGEEDECATCDAQFEPLHLGFDHSLVDEPCVRDDSTECNCARCEAAEDDFWSTQAGGPDFDEPPEREDRTP